MAGRSLTVCLSLQKGKHRIWGTADWCMDIKDTSEDTEKPAWCLCEATQLDLSKIMEIRGSLQWLEKGKCWIYFQRGQERWVGDLQAWRPRFGLWETHGASPLKKRRLWIARFNNGKLCLNQSDCFKLQKTTYDPLNGWGETRGAEIYLGFALSLHKTLPPQPHW